MQARAWIQRICYLHSTAGAAGLICGKRQRTIWWAFEPPPVVVSSRCLAGLSLEKSSSGVVGCSVLDLSPIVEGGTAAQSFQRTRELAQHAERCGYTRYWLAEHHNFPGIASAATAVVIAHVGAATSRIRIGAGGIMLPNHAPIMVAEQFGTLEALFPGRVDLGVGRAPGTDPLTTRALRRTLNSNPDEFPRDLAELMAFLRDPAPGQVIKAVPGAGSNVPIWVLGSSLFGAQVAAAFGLPFSFASHFAPTLLMEALAVYRERFQPSDQLARPYVMPGVNVVAAATDAEARFLASSGRQAFTRLRQGQPIALPPPSVEWEKPEVPEGSDVDRVFKASVVGSPETVRRLLHDFIARTNADELIVATQIYDHAARLRSYEIVADVMPLTPQFT
jgi:luciferase family oxidoreductase group 1